MSTPGSEPTEEELREAYEAELSRVSVGDMLLQTVVSLLNVGARRAGLLGQAPGEEPPPVDLDQASDAIDAVRALLPLLERRRGEDLRPLRDALSQLQMAYARQKQAPEQQPVAAKDAAPGAPTATQTDESAPQAQPGEHSPGPAESSGRLWVPGR